MGDTDDDEPPRSAVGSEDGEDEDEKKPWRTSRSPAGWLAVMVAPGECSEQALADIWDCVTEENALLPGGWDTSATGAFVAARQGDWAVCAYLAARCFVDAGADALAAPIDGAHAALWLWVVDPIVLDIPAGCERLWVRVEGRSEPEWVPTDRLRPPQGGDGLRVLDGNVWRNAVLEGKPHECAEHFLVGKVLGLSRLTWPGPRVKCLALSQEELLQLRACVTKEDAVAELPAFLKQEVRLTSVFRGGSFQVLAYPVAGDFTKALLRPVEKSWQEPQKSAATEILSSNGDRLLNHFAKAGKWSLVERLLKVGVPCPDFREEFADVCGSHGLVRRDWLRDLTKQTGCQSRSLFELAFNASLETLQGILSSLLEQGRLPDLNKPPLIVAAASAGRWDVAKALLDLDGAVSVAPLLESRALENATSEFQEFVKVLGARGARAADLKEYFSRSLAGESMGSDTQMIPVGFEREGSCVLQGQNGQCVLDRGVRFGTTGKCLVFVSVSEEEFDASCTAVCEGELMLPVDLRGAPRQASICAPKTAGRWVAVLCPSTALRMDDLTGQFLLSIPEGMENCVPNPIIPQATVRIVVKTPCCEKLLEGVIIHVNGRRAGTSNSSGELHLVLPAGQHTVSLPNQSSESQNKVVNVAFSAAREQTVELYISGALYLFLQSVGGKHAVKLTTNRYKVPVEALSFKGQATLEGPASSDRSAEDTTVGQAFAPLLCIKAGIGCAEQLPCHVQPHSSYGGAWEPAFEVDAWYTEMADQGECSVALLFSVQQPVTLGYIVGANVLAIAPTVSPPASSRVDSSVPYTYREDAAAVVPFRVEVAIPSRVPPAMPCRPRSAAQRFQSAVQPQASSSKATGSLRPRLLQTGGGAGKGVTSRAEEPPQDMAVRLVEVLKKTLDNRLGDIKERLHCVESNHRHMEDQLQRRPKPKIRQVPAQQRGAVRGGGGAVRRDRDGGTVRGSGRRSNSVA